jgi:hypothetical protein
MLRVMSGHLHPKWNEIHSRSRVNVEIEKEIRHAYHLQIPRKAKKSVSCLSFSSSTTFRLQDWRTVDLHVATAIAPQVVMFPLLKLQHSVQFE